MLILGALILVGGGGYAVYDFLRAGTVAAGGECYDSAHCQSGDCIHAGADISGVCADPCDAGGGCAAGLVCQKVDYETANGQTVEGYASYCVPEGL